MLVKLVNTSLAQSFAEEAVDNRDTAIEALNENPEDA